MNTEGWLPQVAEIYHRAVEEIDNLLPQPCEANDWQTWRGEPLSGETAMDFGPGYVVWCGGNYHLAASCARDCDGTLFSNWHKPALEIVKRSLLELAELNL